MADRLAPEVFDLPVPDIRAGYRAAVYFSRTKRILEAERPGTTAAVQVFQKRRAVLCGIDEAIAVLRVGAGHWADAEQASERFGQYLSAQREGRRLWALDRDAAEEARARRDRAERALDELWVPGFDELDVRALHDGDRIEPWETVAHVTGPLRLFVHLESLYLGVLARRTRIATNVAAVVSAAGAKPVLYFADRFDHLTLHEGDGYAAHVGGVGGVSVDAMGAWWGAPGLGTMPHALVAAYDGDTVAATSAFTRHFPDVDLIALVDFNDDCVGDSLACARTFGERLWGVRLDTPETVVDRSITTERMGDFIPTGVNVPLVRMVRAALDAEGFSHVRIVVSGGFDAERVAAFEEQDAPVDAYGVGSALLRGAYDFTADVVTIDGRPRAKVGRRFRPNPRLQPVG